MNTILEWVRKNNHRDWTKMIVSVFVYAGFCLLYSSENNTTAFLMVGGLLAVVICLDAGRYFVDSYLTVYTGGILPGEVQLLSEIMRYHPFDTERYFWYIRTKMKWLVGIVGGISLGLTVLGSMPETGTGIVWRRTVPFLIVGLCCTVAPCVMYLLKKKLFIRQLQRGTEGKLSLALKVFNSLFLIVEVVLLFVVAAVSLLLLWGIFTDMVSPEIDESLMILRNFYGFAGSYLLIILAAFCLIAAALCRKKLFYVGAAIVFLLAVFILVFNAQNYTEFRENEFVIYHFGEEKVYQIEDIKSFRIYADKKDEQIQLELNFQDGVSRKTMGTAQTCSQRYEEQYYSDYNFIADYVAKLKEAGVSGELENTGKLQEYVEGLDRQVKQGLDKIIVEMEE